ncbi:RNA polymerase sigma factor [Anaeromyxobacter paludicola]|uniref:RNA polymerase, sigma-24 subunit, ECF subfamily n=1 Tax=Anaeromyxobacter paludicola TaxID=2918171 RepID=A0ABM7XA63_9BACT|nr:hypothetical protein [Anaeromyxobacter paludicola]BDG08739.1 hypothetical protein AMPC_18520 [Anaeromyxobacter paludicola]
MQEDLRPSDDLDLVRAAARGDEAAFALLIDDCWDVIAGEVVRTRFRVLGQRLRRDDDPVRDATVDVLARISAPVAKGRPELKLSRFDPSKANLRTWLRSVARHCTFNRISQELRRHQLLEALERIALVYPDPDRGMDEEDHRRMVEMAMGRLAPHHRQVIELKYYATTLERVAEVMRLPPAVVLAKLDLRADELTLPLPIRQMAALLDETPEATNSRLGVARKELKQLCARLHWEETHPEEVLA